MTDLRDQFAMAALTGLLAGETNSSVFPDYKEYSRAAYKYADAMLEARERGRLADPMPAREPMVDDLDLSVRAANFLQEKGIKTIAELKKQGPSRIRNMGATAKMAKEIFAELDRSGL